jgi:signal transduction histidine kinase
MRLQTRILLAILVTLLVGDVLGTLVVQQGFRSGAQREAQAQAAARAQQVQSLYRERAATLTAEGEAISLYPAVIAALVDDNPGPLRRWSGQVARLQGTSVTVTDARGRVVARGHAPDQSGDELAGSLAGLRTALGGEATQGVEAGDELGPALRGYVPVLAGGIDGPIVGAVMIADPLDARFLGRLSSGDERVQMRLDPTRVAGPATIECETPSDAQGTCRVAFAAPAGDLAPGVAFDVPLDAVAQARADAQRNLWLASAAVLVLGTAAAWWLARSLTRPLARLTAAAQLIAGGDLSAPVEVARADEIGTLGGAFEHMRGRVADMTTRLRDERDVLNAVLEATEDGILMVDADGRTVVANRAWVRLVGEPGLTTVRDLRRADGVAETFGEMVERWLGDPEHIGSGDLERAQPFARLRAYSAPVRFDVDDAVLGRLIVLRDVTAESEAERMRSALVATVSHELRSPLTAITGYTQTLLHDGPWDAATEREFLEVVALSAARLSALVDNLLDAATLDAGVLRLQREPVRVERLAERVLAQRRLLSGACTLELETRPGVPVADADPLRVEQVLANLVDNAIKYSPGGGTVRVRVLAAAGEDAVLVTVADEGVGIPADAAAQLFERFFRVDGGLPGVKGVGLGLYICRSLVESHGGRIWVESRPGAGSIFAFTLPAVVQLTDDEPPPERAGGPPLAAPRRGGSG